jgi:hypothetical protein
MWLGFPELSFLDQASNPDQDYGANESDDNSSDYPAARPDPNQPKQPAAYDASQYAEDDVYENAVATASHYRARQPTGDQTGHNPRE